MVSEIFIFGAFPTIFTKSLKNNKGGDQNP